MLDASAAQIAPDLVFAVICIVFGFIVGRWSAPKSDKEDKAVPDDNVVFDHNVGIRFPSFEHEAFRRSRLEAAEAATDWVRDMGKVDNRSYPEKAPGQTYIDYLSMSMQKKQTAGLAGPDKAADLPPGFIPWLELSMKQAQQQGMITTPSCRDCEYWGKGATDKDPWAPCHRIWGDGNMMKIHSGYGVALTHGAFGCAQFQPRVNPPVAPADSTEVKSS